MPYRVLLSVEDNDAEYYIIKMGVEELKMPVQLHRVSVKALEARANSLYEIQLYLAILYEGFRPQKKLLGSLRRAADDAAAQAARALESLLVLSVRFNP